MKVEDRLQKQHQNKEVIIGKKYKGATKTEMKGMKQKHVNFMHHICHISVPYLYLSLFFLFSFLPQFFFPLIILEIVIFKTTRRKLYLLKSAVNALTFDTTSYWYVSQFNSCSVCV